MFNIYDALTSDEVTGLIITIVVILVLLCLFVSSIKVVKQILVLNKSLPTFLINEVIHEFTKTAE